MKFAVFVAARYLKRIVWLSMSETFMSTLKRFNAMFVVYESRGKVSNLTN